MADITDNSGSESSQPTGLGKPILRQPLTLEEALASELSAAAAVLRLAVDWRVACQRAAKVPEAAESARAETESAADIDLSALCEMREFKQYRKAIAQFVAIVTRTDSQTVAQKASSRNIRRSKKAF